MKRALTGLGFYVVLAVVAFLGAVRATGLWSRSWELPLFYRSDALAGGAQFKGTIENGWYETNPALGAPHGLVLHPFPLADNLQFLVARVLGTMIEQWSVAYNLAYMLTFPAAAVTGAWFVRRFGVSRAAAAMVGLLFAFTPYHFMHGLPHLSLSMYFTVPLVAWLSVAVMTGRPIWSRRPGGGRFNPLRWATATTFGTVAIALLVGSTSSYYAVFGLIFLGLATLVALLARRWRDAVAAVAGGAAIVMVMLVNMAPDILWQRGNVASPAEFGRQPLEAELYAFKFSSLIFPTHWNRIGDLGPWRFSYDETFPLPGERAALGVVAAAGFVVLLALPLVLLVRGRRPGAWWPGPLVSTLSLFSWAGFAFGTVGGLATLFALAVSPDIRAWNRIVVFLALFALTLVAMVLDRAGALLAARLGRSSSPSRRRLLARVAPVSLAAAVLGVGLFDQVAPASWALIGDEQERWDNDEAYVAEIEDRVDPGTMIFQLPAMAYPESLPLHEMEDYELMRPYLHSDDLRWSYGAVKGRPVGDWTLTASQLPTERLTVALGAAGFGGIHVDRFGYTAEEVAELEATLERILDTEPMVSPDGRFVFFDMSDFVDRLEAERPDGWRAKVGSHLVSPPTLYTQQDFNPPAAQADGQIALPGKSAQPALDILSPRRDATPMTISFTLRVDGARSSVPVDVAWPGGDSDRIDVPLEGRRVSRRILVPAGASEIAFSASGVTSISLVGTAFEDPVLRFSPTFMTASDEGRAGAGKGRRG